MKWKITLFGGGILLLLLVAFVLRCRIVGADCWSAMEQRVRTPFPALTVERVFRGGGVPGEDAWGDYRPMLEGFEKADFGHPDWRALEDFAYRKKEADPERAKSLVGTLRPALEALARGSRRKAGGAAPAHLSLKVQRTLTALVRSEARLRDTPRDAADVALDLAYFGAEFQRKSDGQPLMFARATLSDALEELVDVVRSPRLGKDDAFAIGRELEALDRGFRDVGPIETSDVLRLGLEFLDATDLWGELRKPRCMCAEHCCPPWGAWRYGFSDRLMAARAFEEALGYAEMSEAVVRAPWSEAGRVGNEILERMIASPNPLIRSHVVELLGRDRSTRELRARLRLLRQAFAIRAGVDVPDLEDPLGVRLRRAGSRLWSAGRDGRDDGGKGAWRQVRDSEVDLVLELAP